jgi:Domain of unknown function (DUF1843)
MSVNSKEEKPLIIPAYGAPPIQASTTSDLEQLNQLKAEAEGRVAELGGVFEQIKDKISGLRGGLLYAAAMTQVTAGGDLAEMKRLEAAAEQQLADHDDVAKALQALKAEIAKLS